MAAANISSEKIDLLIYGPIRPILENGFSDQFVLHMAESRADLERLTPETIAKIRGMAVTYHTVPADRAALAQFSKLEIVASFGVGYDHVDSAYAREHNIVVTNTPDVLTEEVADVAMGLLISTLREFVKADRYLRSGLWQTQNYPLSVGSLRDRKIGIVGMGRIGQAIGRRLEASLVPVSYHSRNPSSAVSYTHYPDLMEMAKAVDTLIVIVPGGASTAKMINADVLKALGPRGVLINVARGSVVDEPALLTALLALASQAAGQDASTLKKDMVGQWELATTERSKTCIVTLKGDTTSQGFKLELEPGCAAALPFTKEITAWNIKGLDIVRMQDAAGQSVIDFTEVESGIFEGLRTGEGVYILQYLAAARSLAKSMDQMIGDWSMVRGNGQTICGLTLTNTEATGDNFQVFLKPKCDPAVAAFAPNQWRLDHGPMLLPSAKGRNWQVEGADESQWRTVSDAGDPP